MQINYNALNFNFEKNLIRLSENILHNKDILNAPFKFFLQAHSFESCFVVSGIGKSAIIAQKLVATLISVGINARFLHVSEALHGDLGLIKFSDSLLFISNSGNTPEIITNIDVFKQKIKNIGLICGNNKGKLNDYIPQHIVYSYESELDEYNLVPTVSTVIQLALCECIAAYFMQKSGFNETIFSKNHPGGMLGKRLNMRVADIMEKKLLPNVHINSSLHDVILSISSGKQGATIVLENNRIKGIITDGDLRRTLEKEENLVGKTAFDLMSKNPLQIEENMLVQDALTLIKSKKVSQLIVARNENYVGLLHIHQIINEGF